MARHVIPERAVWTCDRCGDGMHQSLGMRLRGDEGGRAYDGSTGGGPVSVDLCENCAAKFHQWMAAGKPASGDGDSK